MREVWFRWFVEARKFGATISFGFRGFDASRDVCLKCGSERRFHSDNKDHRFAPREKD
jgi:hypothetical protein